MKDIMELSTIYDKKQSFYGKAHIIEKRKGIFTLLSYSTEVLTYNENTKTLKLNEYSVCSQTTLRHVREFLLQLGIKPNKILINGEYLKDFSKKILELLVDRKIKINQDNIIKIRKKVS